MSLPPDVEGPCRQCGYLDGSPECRGFHHAQRELYLLRAEEELDAGNVERAWYYHGRADGALLMLDPVQARDPLYGSDYREGYHDERVGNGSPY